MCHIDGSAIFAAIYERWPRRQVAKWRAAFVRIAEKCCSARRFDERALVAATGSTHLSSVCYHPDMPLAQATCLVKSFHSGQSALGLRASGLVRAVNNVSLAIDAGETLGLVGESGSGKSTLGRMLLRLIEPDSGEVTFDGRDVLGACGAELRRLRRDMQIIFQDPFGSLDPRMTVEQIVTEPMDVHGSEGRGMRKQCAAEMLRAVGLDASALAR